jgi:glycine cleavage system transcriptional repressor
MQLAITTLSNKPSDFITEIIPAITDCNCRIVEIRYSKVANANAAHMLIAGDWNHIAKLENALDIIQNRLNINIQKLRTEKDAEKEALIPYSLETISLNREGILQCITTFLTDRNIIIHEITGSSYKAPYNQSSLFSTKFVVLVPPEIQLLPLREEFLDFCDQLNIDAILEPIKR